MGASDVVDIHDMDADPWISAWADEVVRDSFGVMALLDRSIPRREAGAEFASASLRLQVRLRRRRVDRLLAEGVSPTSDPQLALRAAQLTRPAVRARLAAGLRDGVRSVDESALTLRRRPQAPVDATSVQACASEMGELARALTDINPRVRGAAIVNALLTDGLSPLYAGDQAGRLHDAILSARSAL
jgi:hypothetical protein